MLSACGGLRDKVPPQPVPDPVIVTRTEVRTICPAEVTAPIAARPAVPDGAELNGNEAGMGWLEAMFARLGLLEDRLADARKECP